MLQDIAWILQKNANLNYQMDLFSSAQNENPMTSDYEHAKFAKSAAMQFCTPVQISRSEHRQRG